MGQTTFSGPIKVGDKDGTVGEMILHQEYSFTYTSTGSAFATTIVIPAGARILDIYLDISTAFSHATTLEIGDGTDADEYADFTSLLAAGAGRHVATFDAAQEAVIQDVGTSDVTITVTPTTESTTAGVAILCVDYIKR